MKTIADVMVKSRREFLFDNIIPDAEKVYFLRIKDFMSSKLATEDKYFLFECEAIEDMPELTVCKGEWFIQHFPVRAFMLSWDKFPLRKNLKKGDYCDVLLMFKRLTKKKIEFVKLEIIRKEGDEDDRIQERKQTD
jgi:hypothetical protein